MHSEERKTVHSMYKDMNNINHFSCENCCMCKYIYDRSEYDKMQYLNSLGVGAEFPLENFFPTWSKKLE